MGSAKQIEDIERQEKILAARKNLIKQRDKHQFRKAETSAKIIAGAWVWWMLEKGKGLKFDITFPKMAEFFNDRDKKKMRRYALMKIEKGDWPENITPLIDQYFPGKKLTK